jgi:4-amino-4-deoxy-L-arabinose transferase-like glycosyltransferase
MAVLLAAATVVLLAATAPDIGLTWDEPAYIIASESYTTWLGELAARPRYALSAEGIQRYWSINHEHPPLDKVWSGLVWRVARAIFDDLTAHRLGNILLAGLLVALLYCLVAGELNRTAGLAAVGALLTMPRFFFHAHLAALDVPAAAAVLGVVFAFWRTRKRASPAWDVLLGVLWGLAMAVKINALLVPPALFLWAVLVRRQRHLFRRLIVMGLVGLPLFVGVWPWLYREFVPRLLEYVLFVTVDHWPIGQYYLGQVHMPPPWHFGFVTILSVVPLATTALYVLGGIRIARRDAPRALCAFGLLLAICALVPPLTLAAGQTMVYDNDRLFMPAYPFFAALAGVGFEWAVRALRGRVPPLHRSAWPAWPALAGLALAVAAFGPQVIRAADLYPHLLSYYSEGIGGLRGATAIGLETTYWCETYAEALPYLNAHARPGDTVRVENCSHDVLLYYQLQGLLDDGLRVASRGRAASVFYRQGVTGYEVARDEADYVLVQYRQTGFRQSLVDWMARREPVYQVSHRGIPLFEIYAQ